jgi:hypothetical protein
VNNLNALAESIAATHNKLTDVVFIEKLKFDIKTLRSLFIKQDTERNLIDNRLIQSVCFDLIRVDISECCSAASNCMIHRTTNKVPMPIKLKSSGSFSYVGDLVGNGYSFSKVEDWDLEKFRRFNLNKPFYDYYNGYIYIKNNKVREFLLVKGIFEDPDELSKCCSTTANTAVLESDTYPLPLDLAGRIKDVIESRLRRYEGEDKEVKIDVENVKK